MGFTRRTRRGMSQADGLSRQGRNGDWTAEGAEERRGVCRWCTAPCTGAGTEWGWAPLHSTPSSRRGRTVGRSLLPFPAAVPYCRSCRFPPAPLPLSCCHPAGARRRRASVGIYSPCRVASHAVRTGDPDTRSLRSLLRDDRRTEAVSIEPMTGSRQSARVRHSLRSPTGWTGWTWRLGDRDRASRGPTW